MANPNEKNGTIVSVESNYESGVLQPGDGGPDVEFQNPVFLVITPGQGVTYLSITNPKTGIVKNIITGKD